MANTPNNPDRTVDLATLIRCAADDSLSMAQADALRAHLDAHPEDQARIDFERGLRDTTASVMNSGPAPAALRQSIEAMLAEYRNAETVGPHATRDQSFWRRSILPLAVAAAVLLTFGVTMMISNQSQTSGWSDGLASRAVSWVQREHNKCCESVEYRENKLSITNVTDVREIVRRSMGAAPTRIQLDDVGYTFAGYGGCNIPGGGPSGQLIYTPNDGIGSPISLFIQRDDGQLDNVATTSDCLKGVVGDFNKSPGGASTGVTTGARSDDQIFIWRADGLIYYMVTRQHNEADPFLKSLGAPENQISI